MSRLSRWYLAIGVVLTILYFLLPSIAAQQVIWSIIGWSSVIAIVVGIRVNHPEPRSAWYLLAVGVATLIIGDDLYSLGHVVQRADGLFPSYINVSYLAMYPLLIGGLMLLVRRRSDGRDRSRIVDAFIITASFGLVSWVLLIAPNIRTEDLSVGERLISTAYPIGDIALLAVALLLAVGGGRRSGVFWMVVGGLAALLVSDGLFDYLNLYGSYSEHAVFYLAWGAAALHPSVSDLSMATAITRRVSTAQLVMIASALLVPPAMLFAQDAVGNVSDATPIALIGGLLSVLVLIRIVLLVRGAAGEKSEVRFRALVDKTSDAIVVVDDGARIRYHTPSAERLLGRCAAELDGAILTELVGHADGQRLRAILSNRSASTSVEWRVEHGDGAWHDLDVIVDDLRGTPEVDGIVLTMRDITDRKRLDLELRHQTLHDSLTGLPNRLLFSDRVDQALTRAAPRHGSVAVLVLDLDDFKMVNDSLGYAAGDDLLRAVAARLITATLPGDSVSCFGGDEFGFLLDNGDVAEGSELAALRIQAALQAPVVVGDKEVHVHASIGMAVGSGRTHTADDVLRDADLAMSFAKRKGKDRFELFLPAMYEDATRRLEVAVELLDGIERGEFAVFYQPIVDIDKARTVGAEALVRWQHPRRGLLGPAEFIPIAETTGLIASLGRWVLNEACRQTHAWNEAHLTDDSFYISVNLSALHLQDVNVEHDISSALEASGLAGEALVLEVTETALIDNIDSATSTLARLKRLGVRIAVDDFGTGYSSLSHLVRFPLDIIKIDKSFIDQIANGTDGEVMVRAVVDLAHTLGLKAIAEGVEHPEQARALHDLDCHLAQGYLFSPPVSAGDMTALLDDQSVGRVRTGPPERLRR